ncbi:MAG: hypothetical protein V3V95_04035, partial [Thermodesulfobacteriota bacterium]
MSVSLIIGIVIIGGGLFFLLTSIPRKPKEKDDTSDTKGSGGAALADADEPDEIEEGVPYTGKVTQVAEKAWVLNPKSPFPLTVYGIDEDLVSELKSLLDNRYKTTATEALRKLKPFIDEHTVGCKEIDDYVNVFRPIYMSKFNEYKDASATFDGATATAAAKRTASTAADKAIKELEIQLHCDLEILFRGHPKGKKTKEELLKKYGADVMKLYVSMRKGINTVEHNPEIRKIFEKLEEFGLVAYGPNVNPKLLLKTISLKNMRKIVFDLNYPAFEDKETGYKAISILPDLTERLRGVVNYKTIYEKLPIPPDKDELPVSDLEHSDYLSEFAALLLATYFRGGISIQERKEF